MATSVPSIVCLGVIGRNNNPLHISIFPSYDPTSDALVPVRTPLQFSLLLSSTLDVFELRARHNAASNVGLSGDFGLLHAVDERLAAYGHETNTGVKFVCVVDMRGRRVDSSALLLGGSGAATAAATAAERDRARGAAAVGLRDGELKIVFKAMQSAYIGLLQNPFYDPDDHSPPGGKGGKRITSRKFAEEVRRIGQTWTPGIMTL